jgi:hypothetical protein
VHLCEDLYHLLIFIILLPDVMILKDRLEVISDMFEFSVEFVFVGLIIGTSLL